MSDDASEKRDPRLFSADNQPEHRGRKKKAVLYAGQIRDLEDGLADALPAIGPAIIAILTGTFEQDAVNHKTGEVVKVGPTADQVIKAAEFAANRIAGKPVDVKQLEIQGGPTGVFNILLGAAADDHWAQRLAAKQDPLAIEAAVEVHEPEGPR